MKKHKHVDKLVHDQEHAAACGNVDTGWFMKHISEDSGRDISSPEPVFLNRHYSDLMKEVEVFTEDHPVWEYEHAWPGSDQWRVYDDNDSKILEKAAQELEKTKNHELFVLENEWGKYNVSLYRTDRQNKFFASYEPLHKSGVHEPYTCYVRRRIEVGKPKPVPPIMPPYVARNVARALEASKMRKDLKAKASELHLSGDSFAFRPRNKTATSQLHMGVYKIPSQDSREALSTTKPSSSGSDSRMLISKLSSSGNLRSGLQSGIRHMRSTNKNRT